MADIIDPASRMDKLLAQQDRRIAAAFRQAIAQLRGDIDIDALADLIEAGNIDAAIDALNDAARRVGAAYNVAFMTAGQSTSGFLQSAGFIQAVFDVAASPAVAVMQNNMLRTITEFSQEQRASTQAALIAGAQRGDGPRAQARAFRDSIGLTQTQQQAVQSYRRSLESIGRGSDSASDVLGRALRDKRYDATVVRAVRASEPIPADRVDQMVKRYAERYVKYRSEVIGRTEALGAVNAGNHEMYRQSIERGWLNESDLVRIWNTSVDGRERRTHRFLNKKKVGFNEPWVSISGAVLMFPGDPSAPAAEIIQCRCSPSMRIKRAK